MPLDTRIYVHGPVDYRQAFVKCNQLTGADEGVRFTDEPVPPQPGRERKRREDGEWTIWTARGRGLCALLDISYRKSGPLRMPGDHAQYCEPDEDGCVGGCAPPCWLEVSFCTSYGYSGPEGGCRDLHARLVAELGRWLDDKGIAWSWRNEFGEVHQRYDGLAELGRGGLRHSPGSHPRSPRQSGRLEKAP